MKKSLIIGLFAIICSFGAAYSQERINEFVVEIDESHNPMTFYSSYGATPNDGVVIINSTIPDLEFGIMSVAKERLRKVVPDKGKNRYVLIIQPNDSNYKQYTITINAKGFKQGKIDYVVVKAGSSSGYIVNSKFGYTSDNLDYVDLGLPSGTLWATCNLGASKPEDYGNYFAWGETHTKDLYNWDTYKHVYVEIDYERKLFVSCKLTKYCTMSEDGYNGFTDNLTTLQDIDDPAAARRGYGWRTPSKAQWEELLNNTTYQWTTKNGVKGCILTSKKNRQTLFLPAAGTRYDGKLNRPELDGWYWSRSLDTEFPMDARIFGIDSRECGIGGANRYEGLSVRPVYSSQK